MDADTVYDVVEGINLGCLRSFPHQKFHLNICSFGPGLGCHSYYAISSIDTAAMVAAWSDASVPENLRGTTVSLTVSYLAPAEHEDIQATARVLRRGRNLVYLDVEVQSVSGKSIARGLVTYKLG